jgi:hypothetical protein
MAVLGAANSGINGVFCRQAYSGNNEITTTSKEMLFIFPLTILMVKRYIKGTG